MEKKKHTNTCNTPKKLWKKLYKIVKRAAFHPYIKNEAPNLNYPHKLATRHITLCN